MLETTVPRGFHHLTVLAEAGVETTFVTEDLTRYASVPGYAERRNATRIVQVPSIGEGLADQLREDLGAKPVDGVLCVHDRYLVAANTLARDFGTPYEPPETIALLRDKAAVRARLAEAGLGTLRWHAGADSAEVGFPLVVKPLTNYGSIGVAVCWDETELGQHLAAAPGPVLLEQYVSGRHVSAEVLVQDGRPMVLGFAERLPAPPGVAAEVGGHFPARFEGLGAARRLVHDIVAALGVRNSALHVELMITASGPQLVEVNARVAGHVVAEQISRALDRNVTLDLLHLAVGKPLEPLDEPVRTLALRQFWTTRPGTLRAIHIPDLPPEVVRCEAVVQPGDRVRTLRDNFDRLGYLLTEAPTPSRALAVADAVLQEVRFDVVHDEAESATAAYEKQVLLVLGSADPERILDAAGASTRQLSVLWTGDRALAESVRQYWAARFHGQWFDDGTAVKPPDTVVHLQPGLAARTAEVRATNPPAEDVRGNAPGRIVVLLVAPDSTALPWAVLDDDGCGTVRAAEARRSFAADRSWDGPAVVCIGEDGSVTYGIDASLRALCDAFLDRDLTSALITTGLTGVLPPPPRVRNRGAILRRLPAPAGRFRVAEATPVDVLYADPAVLYAVAPMPAGHLHHGEPADRLSYVATSEADCARIERSLRFRHTPQDRTHVLIVDRFGPAGWTRTDGTPVLPADRFRTTVISNQPAGGVLYADTFDQPLLSGLADAVHVADPVNRVACGTEHLLASAADLRDRWSLPGDSPQQIRAVRDKAEMKRIARRFGIPHAPGTVLHEPQQLLRLLEEHGSVVVKPRDRSGAQGVRILSDRTACDEWLGSTFLPGSQLAEAYQSGPVCHVDAVVHRGIVAWEVSRYGDQALAFTDGQPVTSWTVDDDRLRGHARELLERVLAAWAITNGVLHLEAFDAGTHLVFNEVAGRAGGGGVVPTFTLTRGIDLRHAKLAIDAGDDPRRLLTEPVAEYAGWIVHYSPGGRLDAYDDSTVAASAAYRQLNAAPGDDVPTAAFRGTGLATYCFAAGSEVEVRELLRRATTIDIRVTRNH
jgi:biotin carboxylase